MEDRSGEVLHGIPALEDVDPDTFGICLATADGYVYEEGDTDLPFCIQSISKAFTYGMALRTTAPSAVDAKIDVEPSGDLFNEISLHPVTHRPRNPMINAGAIAASSMVAGQDVHEQVERVQAHLLGVRRPRRWRSTRRSTRRCRSPGHRNRAISHMLREFGILECSPDDALEVYLRQCAVMVTCCDLAMMGATLANLGHQPRDREDGAAPDLHRAGAQRDVHLRHVRRRRRVGGVGGHGGQERGGGRHRGGAAGPAGAGGVLAAAGRARQQRPRRAGLPPAVAGPRAARAARDPRAHTAAIRDPYDILEAPSAMQRPQADREVLEVYGRRARIYEVHGDLLFSGAESVVREIASAGEDLELLVLDVRRIGDVPTWPGGCWSRLRASLLERDCDAVLVDPDGRCRSPGRRRRAPGARVPHASWPPRCGARTSCWSATATACPECRRRSSGWPTTRCCGTCPPSWWRARAADGAARVRGR